eukprot:gene12573-8616_t
MSSTQPPTQLTLRHHSNTLFIYQTNHQYTVVSRSRIPIGSPSSLCQLLNTATTI